MPQMMPLLWMLNMMYTSLLINLYLMMLHFMNSIILSNMNKNPSTKLKIKYQW